ncbi:rnase p rpr2 rpp21 subunit domain-containing protein [Diplodia corticola]|uniref:Rnase p rpr2 rpp21 subunit domain-containing protein n=1 Tax=Diplodia corticola TaxID=236234 RepID=A0A1J9R1G3_9PEZI|nr:rnase p rpr2 rpp21 subunit domain-containing protein [Diplodia corticola]OJD35230.1 rnase p rpr2 rpp21 subunit domain-containing protein [Diplodia corticola]
MAKGDASKPKAVPNKHLHSRISYLYQAATYLANQSGQRAEQRNGGNAGDPGQNAFPPGLPFYYASHLHSVSMKSQIRLSQDVKNSVCKRCNAILIPGNTSSSKIENLSRGAKKPWADVLVVECNVCNAQKRYPVGAKRQPKKSEKARPASMRADKDVTENMEMEKR